MKGIIGRKLGMTRLFNKEGISIPVTIISVQLNYVTQIKNIKKNGYHAIQVTTGYKNINRINKPDMGNLVKSGHKCGSGLWEFRINDDAVKKIGDVNTVQIFENVEKVDVTGISKGKGFSGTIKRWNFHMQDASHGNSLSHRAPGSIGQNQTPGRVFKGKKMAGQLGVCQVTVQNLDIIKIDIPQGLLLIKGSVPGSIGGYLRIKSAVKKHIPKEII